MIKEKIRILHVAEAAGGVDRYLRVLFKYLDSSRFENILVASQNYNESDYANLNLRFVPFEMAHEIGTGDLSTVLRLRKVIKEYNPDIVYAHSSKAGAIARIANFGLKNNCIYNPHGWAFNMQVSDKKKAVYRIIEKVLAGFCDKIICISPAEKVSALANGICSEKKLNVITNGIDFDEFKLRESTVTRASVGIPDDAFVVGMIGRLSEQKAPDTFVKMASEVRKTIPEAHFVIVGNGNLEDECRELAEKLGISESLHITGWVDNPIDYLRLFDVATLLSRWEGFGLAIAEYMMCHKPVVATDTDAIPYLVDDGRTGILVPVDDYKKTAEAVCRLHDDIGFRERLISDAYEKVVKEFDAKRVAKQHEELFESICFR
ncbi:MAG: glycosyltransferase family 4 protein [Clostridia bacterium]|nr:glycosyltransferase family 4 protein [Clostridia bacterium]